MSGGTFCWLVVQEVRRLLLTRWAGGATLVLCACSVLSVLLSIRDLQEYTEAHQELVQQRVEAQVRGTGQVLGRAAEPGLRVIRKPSPGAVLANGIEPTLPAAWEFTPAGSEALAPYARNEVGINGRNLGDLPGIIAGLGSLMALWLGASTIVSDRAAGRIAALRSLPVAPETMAIVRLAGGTLALIVVVSVWCLTVGLSVRAFVSAGVPINSLMPVWMAVPVACYLILMFALGAVTGSAAKEGLSALVMAFVIWMAVVFVLPQVNQFITRSVIQLPLQSRMEIERRNHMADAARLLEQEIGAAMAAQWPDVETPTDEQQRVAYFAVGEPIWSAGLTRIRDAATLEERQWLDERARAVRVKRWIDSVNPSWWLLESMAELAGTGESTATEWTSAIAVHDQDLNQHLFANRPRVNARVAWKGRALVMAFDRHPPPRFSDLPPFVAPPERSSVWTPAALRGLAGLGAYTFLAMAAAYLALRSRLR